MTSSGHSEQTTVLETFEAPTGSDAPAVYTFETDELTALCPFEFGGPDRYDLTVRYEPADRCLESKSLKLWLESFRNEQITAERLADELFRAINGATEPDRLLVRLEQARRGGIEETVEVGDRVLC